MLSVPLFRTFIKNQNTPFTKQMHGHLTDLMMWFLFWSIAYITTKNWVVASLLIDENHSLGPCFFPFAVPLPVTLMTFLPVQRNPRLETDTFISHRAGLFQAVPPVFRIGFEPTVCPCSLSCIWWSRRTQVRSHTKSSKHVLHKKQMTNDTFLWCLHEANASVKLWGASNGMKMACIIELENYVTLNGSY